MQRPAHAPPSRLRPAELTPSCSVIRALGAEPSPAIDVGPTDPTIARLLDCVARALEVPTVVLWLVREQRTLVSAGADPSVWEGLGAAPFLAHALANEDLLLIPDLALDPRFGSSPLVTGAPFARFLAAAALRSANGPWLGALCVVDPRPAAVSRDRAALLPSAAAVAVDLLALAGTTRALAQLEGRERTLRGQFQTMFEDAPLPMYRLDRQGVVVAWNAAATRTFGWTAEEALGRFLPLVPGDKRSEFDQMLARLLDEKQPVRGVRRERLCKNGELRAVRLSLSPLLDARGELSEVVAIVEDVTERERAASELQRVQGELLAAEHALARVDPLTGLANRRGIEESFVRESERARRSGAPVSLALFDIDHFKQLNDDHGHAAGDRALELVASTLAEGVRPYDLAARWGGEELLLIVPGAERAAALVAADRVRTAIATRTAASVHVTVSGGVAQWDGRETLQQTVARADLRLYAAKMAGRNRVL